MGGVGPITTHAARRCAYATEKMKGMQKKRQESDHTGGRGGQSKCEQEHIVVQS